VIALQVGGAGDDEQLVVVDIDLWQLVALDRIFDRQRVEVIIVREAMHFLGGRSGDADPHELALDIAAVDPLVDRHLPDAVPVTIEEGGDDGHACFLGRQGYRAKASFGAATRHRIRSGNLIP
jgi:hypothetical protein